MFEGIIGYKRMLGTLELDFGEHFIEHFRDNEIIGKHSVIREEHMADGISGIAVLPEGMELIGSYASFIEADTNLGNAVAVGTEIIPVVGGNFCTRVVFISEHFF